ncbi:hypothetical protein [Deinococcus petrolearius]|uniref:Lipoprotein n=1 Tax=Deinococcus petrolearius TaxID=1751295 RepID=A0ABW1DJ73_9DEIO
MRGRVLLGALLGLGLGVACAQFSGPSESRTPRAAEVDAVIRAVCTSKVPLGRLRGCRQVSSGGRPGPELRGPQVRLLFSSLLPGTFTVPGRRELLATFCTETESCAGETVLLRWVEGRWVAAELVRGTLLPGPCLTSPRPGGTQAAVCLDESRAGEPLGRALRTVSWPAGKLRVQTAALFPLLGFRDFFGRGSEQCAGRWELEPFSWDDRDRDADGRPDLTVRVTHTTYRSYPGLCTLGMGFSGGALAERSVRRDLTFVWTGDTLRATGTTADTLRKYAGGR